MARRSSSSPGGPRRFPCPEGSHRRSDGVRSHHRRRRLYLGRRGRRAGREQPPGAEGQVGSRPWTRLPASAAVRAWRPARTRQPTCSPAPRSRIWRCCRRVNPSASCASCAWWADGSRRLRKLLERRRMRSGVPEADSDFEYREDGEGIHQGGVERRARVTRVDYDFAFFFTCFVCLSGFGRPASTGLQLRAAGFVSVRFRAPATNSFAGHARKRFIERRSERRAPRRA